MIGFIKTFLKSLLNINNYKKSQLIFSQTLLPWLPRTHSILTGLPLLNWTMLTRIFSPRTTYTRHNYPFVVYVPVGVPTWLPSSQSISALASVWQWSRHEPHRKHNFCIICCMFVWTFSLLSNGVFWFHSLMLWANPSQ
jgi:hypothetical protein